MNEQKTIHRLGPIFSMQSSRYRKYYQARNPMAPSKLTIFEQSDGLDH